MLNWQLACYFSNANHFSFIHFFIANKCQNAFAVTYDQKHIIYVTIIDDYDYVSE